MILKYLLEKEFKQLARNAFIPKLILIFPCLMMLLMPWAANQEVKNIRLCILDNDHSSSSRRLTEKAAASGNFHLTQMASSYAEALRAVERENADVILEIPLHFEKELFRNGHTNVMISANAVNGMKGGLSSVYLSTIVSDFSRELRQENPRPTVHANAPVITWQTLNLFNPHLDYKVFMIPALMVMLLTMLCGFLPALNIVGEKETGTIEQINVTPVGKFTFILAKLIPYWIIGFVVLSLCFLITRFLYGLIPAGNLGTIYFFAALFILLISEFGLIISNYSSTLQQAMFVMFFFIILFVLISGLFTPISSMPRWAQWLTLANPLKYFMEVMRMVYLKGSQLPELLPQLAALSGFLGIFSIWSILSYRKKE